MKDEPVCDELATYEDALIVTQGTLITAEIDWLLAAPGSFVWALIPTENWYQASPRYNKDLWLRRTFLVVRATTGSRTVGPWHGNCQTHDLQLQQLGETGLELFATPVRDHHSWEATHRDWYATQRRPQSCLDDWHVCEMVRFYRLKD